MSSRVSTLLPRSGQASDATAGAGEQRALDWNVAVATALRLMKSGPEVPRREADDVVRALRTFSGTAETHVREITGLGADLPVVEGDVVDRPGWVRGAATGMSALTGTALATAEGQAADGEATAEGETNPLGALSARGAGVQAGAVLAYLGTKVLGQYDPFGAPDGRLLLVAPNIVAAQQALQVPANDFGMWVCLHESTHRLQFTAVPWLRDHFATSLGALLSQLDATAGELLGRLPTAVREVRSGRGNGDSSPGMLGVLELFQNPEQRAALDRIIALSTLLEGHADHVMDAVGPRVVPSVGTIRQRFTERRKGGGLLDRLLRSLLGVDAKIKQYAQGAAFTREVVNSVGMAGFNAVWTGPEHLPTRAEIANPPDWLTRIHG